MPKPVSKDKILKLNPHIDKSTLNESIKLSEVIEASGIKSAQYNLAFPFSRRRIRKSEGDFTCNKGTRISRRI